MVYFFTSKISKVRFIVNTQNQLNSPEAGAVNAALPSCRAPARGLPGHWWGLPVHLSLPSLRVCTLTHSHTHWFLCCFHVNGVSLFPLKVKKKVRLSQNKNNELMTTFHAVFFLNTIFNSPQSWQKHCSPSESLPTTTLTFPTVNLHLCGAVSIVIVHPGGKFRLVEFKNLF